jgi:hypothetical protein
MSEMILADHFITVDNIDYYDVHTFAELTKRSEQSVRLLIGKGNRLIEHLKSIKIGSTLLVPRTELMDFPFCCAGRSKLVVRFHANGSEYVEIVA